MEYRSNVIRFIGHADWINEAFIEMEKSHKKFADAFNKFQDRFSSCQTISEEFIQLEKKYQEFIDTSNKLQFLFASNQATVTFEFKDEKNK